MKTPTPLILIKLTHTIVWLFFNLTLAYLFYAVMTNTVGPLFWYGIGFIVAEFFLLLALRWICPLTILARKYSDDTKDNFDIYLPNCWARHNKSIYSILFAVLVILYISKIGFTF